MLTILAWSAVYSYSMLFRFALSLASPVHSYGAIRLYYSTLILLKHFSLSHMTSFFFYFHTFIMISLLSRFYNKIDSLFYLITYLTSRVFNVILLGPDEALIFFVL